MLLVVRYTYSDVWSKLSEKVHITVVTFLACYVHSSPWAKYKVLILHHQIKFSTFHEEINLGL